MKENRCIKNVYGGSPEIMNLVLMGALVMMEDESENILNILHEQNKDHLAQCIETVMTALRWTSIQLEQMCYRENTDA